MIESLIEDESFFAEILKKSGYKNLAFAMAEILDNSIDADAKNIIILAESERPNSNVQQLGFLDDGAGMEPELLLKSLKIGGRLVDQYRGRTGKFGFGLPGASIANSDVVHVYSWTKKSLGKVYKVSIDANHLNQGISGPVETELPTPYSDFISTDNYIIKNNDEEIGPLNFTESGTLVIWDGCERVSPVRPKTILTKQVKKSLGRLFRHFISNDDDVSGGFKNINLYWVHDLLSGSIPTIHKVKPNDPLYIMSDNQLANQTIPVIFDNIITSECDINGAKLKVTYSLSPRNVRNAYKGKGIINDEVGLNQGISIVREGREIDFSTFGFIDGDGRHRWHGLEIHFESGLDDLFGVPANKQHIDKLRKYDAEEGEFSEDTPPLDLPVYILLQQEFRISETLNEYFKIIKSYASNVPDDPIGPLGDIDGPTGGYISPGDLADDDDNDDDSSSGGVLSSEDDEAVENVRKELIRLGYSEPTSHQINRFLKHKVVWELVSNGEGAGFMDVRTKHGYCILTINKDSSFYQNVLSELYELDKENDTDVTRGVELILLAYARSMDIGRNLEGEKSKMFRKVLTKWSHKSEEFLVDHYE